jgi:hypothetical protein
MIKPTIGRIVWFTPRQVHARQLSVLGPQPMAAQVCFVWNERMVNLDVTDHRGQHHAIPAVLLLQGDETYEPQGSSAEWMPFQRTAQAAQAAPVPVPSTTNPPKDIS